MRVRRSTTPAGRNTSPTRAESEPLVEPPPLPAIRAAGTPPRGRLRKGAKGAAAADAVDAAERKSPSSHSVLTRADSLGWAHEGVHRQDMAQMAAAGSNTTAKVQKGKGQKGEAAPPPPPPPPAAGHGETHQLLAEDVHRDHDHDHVGARVPKPFMLAARARALTHIEPEAKDENAPHLGPPTSTELGRGLQSLTPMSAGLKKLKRNQLKLMDGMALTKSLRKESQDHAAEDLSPAVKEARNYQRKIIAQLRTQLKRAELYHDFRAAFKVYRELQAEQEKSIDDPATVAEFIARAAEKERMTQEQAEQDKLQQESEVQRQRLKEVVVETRKKALDEMQRQLTDAVEKHEYKTAEQLMLAQEKLKNSVLVIRKEESSLTCCSRWCCCVHEEIDEASVLAHQDAELVPESVQLGKHIADSVEVNKINQSTHQIAHLLKPEDLLEYRRYFDLIDSNKTGQIDRNQYTELILLLHQKGHMGARPDEPLPTPREIKLMFESIDRDHNGVVVFNEFCRQLFEIANDTPIEALAQLAFEILDKDGDQHIAAKEIVNFLRLSHPNDTSRESQRNIAVTAGAKKKEEQQQANASLMILEAEEFFNGDTQFRDGQLSYLEFFAVMRECCMPATHLNEAAFPLSRGLWLTLDRRTRVSQSVALLRRKISQGYAGAEDEGENVAKEWHAKHKRMPQCQFMPESKVLWVWDGVQTTLLMYIAFVMPVRLAFDMETVEHGFYWWLDIFLDVFFLCDVVKNFRVAFYDSTTGELVTSNHKIAQGYAHGWMLFDMLSSVPLSLIELLVTSEATTDGSAPKKNSGGDLKLVRILRITKLFRVVKITAVVKKAIRGNPELAYTLEWVVDTIESCKYVFAILMLGHLGGCAWYAAGSSISYERFGEGHPMFIKGCKLCSVGLDVAGGILANETGYWEFDPSDSYVSSRYLAAMFSAMTDMVIETAGGTDVELVLAILIHFSYEIIYGFVLGTLTSMVMESRKSTQEFEEKMATIREFCKIHRLGPQLSTPMLHFFQQLYPDDKVIDTRQILQELPPGLRRKIGSALFSDIIKKVPLFRHFETETANELCCILRPMLALANERIMKEGDRANCMYFITAGRCRVSIRGFKLGHLSTGSFFGELALMGNFAEGGGDGDDENDIHRHNRSVYADPVGKNKEKSCVHLQFLSVEDMAAVNLSHKELSLIKKTVKIYADERARADEARLNPYADHAHHSSRGTPKALECGHIQKAEGGVADGAALAALQLELEARRLECAELRRENGLMQERLDRQWVDLRALAAGGGGGGGGSGAAAPASPGDGPPSGGSRTELEAERVRRAAAEAEAGRRLTAVHAPDRPGRQAAVGDGAADSVDDQLRPPGHLRETRVLAGSSSSHG